MKGYVLLSGYRYTVPLSGRSEDPDDYPPPAFDPLPEAEPQPMQRYYPKHRPRCPAPPVVAMP